jgi:hypothetical protein
MKRLLSSDSHINEEQRQKHRKIHVTKWKTSTSLVIGQMNVHTHHYLQYSQRATQMTNNSVPDVPDLGPKNKGTLTLRLHNVPLTIRNAAVTCTCYVIQYSIYQGYTTGCSYGVKIEIVSVTF